MLEIIKECEQDEETGIINSFDKFASSNFKVCFYEKSQEQYKDNSIDAAKKHHFTMIKFTDASFRPGQKAHFKIPQWNTDYMLKYSVKHWRPHVRLLRRIHNLYLPDWYHSSIRFFDSSCNSKLSRTNNLKRALKRKLIKGILKTKCKVTKADINDEKDCQFLADLIDFDRTHFDND